MSSVYSTGDGPPRGNPDLNIIEVLRRQFSAFPVPEEEFNPATARPDVLRRFGLPPKPDRTTQKLLSDAWNKLFGQPMRLQQFVFNADLVLGARYRPVFRAAEMVPITNTGIETSNNWSGGYITANHDRRFLQIWGIWTIPANLQLPPQSLQGPNGIPYICSNWIGLDGQRLYFDSSLPQIGTAAIRQPNGETVAQAWTQWWARGNANTLPLPLGLAVDAGDVVGCVLTAIDPQTVVLVMVNLSQPVPVGMALQGSPPFDFGGVNPVSPTIAGATAEWIMERPNFVEQPGTRCNFPDYGETNFEFCIAVEGHDVDIFSLFDGLAQPLRGVRLLRMFDGLANPARTVFTSIPEKVDEISLRVRYRRLI